MSMAFWTSEGGGGNCLNASPAWSNALQDPGLDLGPKPSPGPTPTERWMPQAKPREAFHMWIFLSNKRQLCAPFPTLQCQGQGPVCQHTGDGRWSLSPSVSGSGLALFQALVGIRKLKVLALNSARAANKFFDFWRPEMEEHSSCQSPQGPPGAGRIWR